MVATINALMVVASAMLVATRDVRAASAYAAAQAAGRPASGAPSGLMILGGRSSVHISV